MASTSGLPPASVTVPDLLGLPAHAARDFAHRSQLIAVGPDPDAGALDSGVVVQQDPPPGAMVPRWSTVVVRTDRSGPGDAGVREPRRPGPPPRSVRLHAEEPPVLEDQGRAGGQGQAAEQPQNVGDGSGAVLP
jgi:hypothetical protein